MYEPPASDLYLVAIGVADYSDPRLKLQFPTKDVDDLIAAMQLQEGILYQRVHVKRMTNEDVTTSTVRQCRAEFVRQARPEDTVIIFVAGHGMRTEDGEYYFLTRDASPENPYLGIDRATLESLVTWDK